MFTYWVANDYKSYISYIPNITVLEVLSEPF